VPALRPGVYLLRARRGQRLARRRLRVVGPATTIVAAGDIACRPGLRRTRTTCHQARTARRVLALRPDVVATLGDAQYQRGELANYLAVYDRSWGAFKAITRPAPGNHEYLERADRTTANGHFGYFGAAAGNPAEGYYSYEAGDWTVFALNTGVPEYTIDGAGSAMRDDCYPVSCAAGSAQVRWLRNRLGQLPDESCALAYWHHPRYASGVPFDYPVTRHLYDALHDHGAEVVLTGHSHSYERFAPMDARGRIDRSRGVRQFVVGTGGRSLFPQPGAPRRFSRYFDTSRFGVLKLSLSTRGYEWRFVGERGGSHDFGSGTCHGPPRTGR
jgi:hypothetical protein